jgi:hypothetical protein
MYGMALLGEYWSEECKEWLVSMGFTIICPTCSVVFTRKEDDGLMAHSSGSYSKLTTAYMLLPLTLVNFKGQHITVNDAHVTIEGAQSDHLSIELKMRIKIWKPKKKGRMHNIEAKNKKTKVDYKVLKENTKKQKSCLTMK